MASLSSLRPTGDFSNSNVSSSAATYWTEIDDDPDSVNTADYVGNTTGYGSGTTACTLFVNVSDMASDFVSMATLSCNIHLSTSGTRTDDNVTIFAQMYQSDGTTTLTDEITMGTWASASPNTGVRSVNFVTVTASNKTTWDGALLKLRWSVVRSGGSDSIQYRVNAVELNGTYNNNTTATPSAVAAVSAVPSMTYRNTETVAAVAVAAVSTVPTVLIGKDSDVSIYGNTYGMAPYGTVAYGYSGFTLSNISQTVSATAVAAISAINLPTIIRTATVTTTAVPVTAYPVAPVISDSENVPTTVVNAISAVNSPTITRTATVTTTVVNAVSAVVSPTVIRTATVTTIAVAAISAVGIPTFTALAAALPSVVNVVSAVGITGKGYVRLGSRGGAYISTPDSAALSVVGDLDVRLCVALDSWTVGGEYHTFASHWNSNSNINWRFNYVEGLLQYQFSRDGLWSGILGAQWGGSGGSIAATSGVSNGNPLWIRATHDVDNGSGGAVVAVYYSTQSPLTDPDSVSWTLLGSYTHVSGAGNRYNSTSPILIGGQEDGNFALGNFYYSEIRSGIGGTIVSKLDLRNLSVDTTSVTDPQANVWTLNGATSVATGSPAITRTATVTTTSVLVTAYPVAVVISDSENISAAVVSAISAVIAPTITRTATVTTSVVNAVSAVGSPTITTTATVTTSAVNAVSAVGSPTIITSATVITTLVAVTAYPNAVVIFDGLSVATTVVSVISAVISPAIKATATLTTSTVSAPATIGLTAVTATTAVTTSTVNATSTIGSPVITATASVSATLVLVTAYPNAITISDSETVSATAVLVAAAVGTITFTALATVLTTLVSVTAYPNAATLLVFLYAITTAVNVVTTVNPTPPSAISPNRLIGWWSFADTATITQSGSAVSSVSDKSAFGHTLTQSTGAAKPSTGQALNYGNALDFDGGDYLENTALTEIDASDTVTMFVVVDGDNGAQEQNILDLRSSSAAYPGYRIYIGTDNQVHVQRVNDSNESAVV